jgi:glucokinase-like ROK family protein
MRIGTERTFRLLKRRLRDVSKRFQNGYQNWVREGNLSAALRQVWEAGQPISRSQIVASSGLTKATVGSLLAQLQEWQLVVESGVSDPRPGRPATLIDLNPEGGRLIGAEIGVDDIKVVLCNLQGKIVWRRTVPTLENGPASMEQVLEKAEQLVQEAIDQSAQCHCRMFGIGVGVPGLVNRTTGTLLFAPNLQWRNLALRDRWEKRFDRPVFVENDAKAGAIGEQTWGKASHLNNFVYLSAGVGLGSGIVLDGRLLKGDGGFAGAVGHMTIEPDGPLCNCGNRGCWETLITPRAVVREVRRVASEGQMPALLAAEGVAGNVSSIRFEHLVKAAAQGDPLILDLFRRVGYYLGIGIANLINAFNPTLVILGGTLSLASDYVLPCARDEVMARALAEVRQDVEIMTSEFGPDACVVGGAALGLHAVLSNPMASIAKARI